MYARVVDLELHWFKVTKIAHQIFENGDKYKSGSMEVNKLPMSNR